MLQVVTWQEARGCHYESSPYILSIVILCYKYHLIFINMLSTNMKI